MTSDQLSNQTPPAPEEQSTETPQSEERPWKGVARCAYREWEDRVLAEKYSGIDPVTGRKW